MGSRVKPWMSLGLAGVLVVVTTGAAAAQGDAEPSDPAESGGTNVTALGTCPMPEPGETAGDGEPTVDPDTEPGSEGCAAPQMEMEDPLGGAPQMRFYVNDIGEDGDVDVVRTSWGPYAMAGPQATEARSNEDIVVAGQRNKILKAGQGTLIGVELASPLKPGDGVHIGTDVQDDATKRAPSSVSSPDNAFANVRQVMSFLLTDDRTPFAGASDLSKAFDYGAKHPFAAWQDGSTVYFYVPEGGLGPDFRVVAVGAPPSAAAASGIASSTAGEAMTFVRAERGALSAPARHSDFRFVAAETSRSQDVAGLGADPGFFSTDGLFGWQPGCVDQLLIHEPLVLESESLSFSKTIASFCFSASARDLAIIGGYMDREGDEFFVIAPIQFTLREEGKDARQARPAGVVVFEGRIYLIFPIGLKAYGFHAITDVEFDPTGDPDVDRVLGQAAPAISRRTNPTVVDDMAGYLQDVPCLDGVPLPEMPWG